MANILVDKGGPPPPNPTKDGEYSDRCPRDGCIETDRIYKFGGRDGHGEEYLHWSMYAADPRKGGCGENWTRHTKQGVVATQARGINPKWKTKSALLDRYASMPSQRYQDAYDCAFQKCNCPKCSPQWKLGLVARCSAECDGHRFKFGWYTIVGPAEIFEEIGLATTD